MNELSHIRIDMNYTLGILAALTTVGCWTIGTFSFTHASRLAPPLSVNRVRLLYAWLILSVVGMIALQVSIVKLFLLPDFWQWFWLGLSGIIGLTIGDFFAFNAYKLIGSSKGSLFTTVAPIAALLLGIVVLNETINWVGVVGMLVSVSGIAWFIRTNEKHASEEHIEKGDLNKGIIFAILGAIGQGFGLVCAKKGLIHATDYSISPLHATWIRMGVGAAATYVIGVFRTNLVEEFKSITLNRQRLKPVLLGTLFGPVIGVSMSLLAAINMEVSLAQTIFSLLPISVMLVAVIGGKERVTFASFIAAIISICGVVILVWRNELAMLF